jgi:hypothetical protein
VYVASHFRSASHKLQFYDSVQAWMKSVVAICALSAGPTRRRGVEGGRVHDFTCGTLYKLSYFFYIMFICKLISAELLVFINQQESKHVTQQCK